MKIRHVFQPDETGCGIACLAMVLDMTYNEVKDWMTKDGIFKLGTDNFTTSFKDLYNVLMKHSVKIERRRKFKRWNNIPAKIAIASTNYDKFGIWHWVIYIRDIDGCYIYDPGKRRKKIRDLRGKMSGWFVEILS